jgi:hypothetical protein
LTPAAALATLVTSAVCAALLLSGPAESGLAASNPVAARAALVRTGLGTGLNQPAPAPPGGAAPAAVGNTTAAASYNWSGYATSNTTAQSFSSVTAGWTVPSVTCSPENRLDAVWVGLDGWADSTVEQLGTEAQCFQGTAYYYTWYEMYPAGTVVEGQSVQPGDKITATVNRAGPNYTLTLTDATTPANSFTATSSCAVTTCLDESAEWVVERPSYTNVGDAPLAKYNAPIRFTSARAGGTAGNGNIGSFANTDSLQMVDATDSYALNNPSALIAPGASFTTTWANSW